MFEANIFFHTDRRICSENEFRKKRLVSIEILFYVFAGVTR